MCTVTNISERVSLLAVAVEPRTVHTVADISDKRPIMAAHT
jgi:hypothetical protein